MNINYVVKEENMTIPRALSSVALVAMGLIGIYFKVEYSGWVIFLGAAVALN